MKILSQIDPIIRAVITAINNMLIDLKAVMSHRDWLNSHQRHKQGIARAHTQGKYRGKQSVQELHKKAMYFRLVKKLSYATNAVVNLMKWIAIKRGGLKSRCHFAIPARRRAG
ncbi:hypothetical protein GJV04_02380 [Enterobacteriaceae bacterium RIT714]|nr:hypothetical protein [Enterobacteriaceae bacterium RIT714]